MIEIERDAIVDLLADRRENVPLFAKEPLDTNFRPAVTQLRK